MTREETIALWSSCEGARQAALAAGQSEDQAHVCAKEVWNTRVTELLNARTREFSIFPRQRGESRERWFAKQAPNAREWINSAKVDFSRVIFTPSRNIDELASGLTKCLGVGTEPYLTFEGFVFPAEADFTETVFDCDTVFDHAIFEGPAWFRTAEFKMGVFFDDAKFKSDAWFTGSTFRGYSRFAKCDFQGTANFVTTIIERNLDMAGAQFAAVPLFNQAKFSEAPDLDNVRMPIPGFWYGGSEGGISAYRAVRRLAIQGYDHENEARAFKGEIRARRGIDHKWFHAAYWVGILYDVLSDFGRSMLRPFWLWALSIPVAALVYMAHASKLSSTTLLCSDGSPAWLKALIFSLKNALLFVNWDREQIQAAYECLYGQGAVPTTNAFIQVSQSIWSALLIFLFLLAVRNQFKIK